MEMTIARKPVAKKSVRSQQSQICDPDTHYSLVTPAGRAAVKALQEQLLSDPTAARNFYISAGIITRTGRLTKRFGG